jgi:hypothetical protein
MLKKLIHTTIVSLLGVSYLAHAAPKQLITHNRTSVESNAYIDGTIPSVYPSKANNDNRVFWASVKLACYGRISNNICHALIKMKSNTPEPVDLGWVTLNLSTGEILPSLIVANGYRMTVNGPGETTIEEVN